MHMVYRQRKTSFHMSSSKLIFQVELEKYHDYGVVNTYDEQITILV